MAENILTMENIVKTYKMGDEQQTVLKGIDLQVDKGEFVAILGPSGSGKSTLMNIIGCLDTATSGTYHLHGRDVSALSESELARVRSKEIGFIFQSFQLLQRQDALQNVELPLIYAGVVGGDGALNDAINGIMLSDAEDKDNIALGNIPNGIGNDFAKYWGLSTEYKPAVDCIINHRLKKIDVGYCNFYDGKEHQRRYFLNAVNIGLGARIVKITDQTKRFWGVKFLSYVAALFSLIFERKLYRMHLRINDEHPVCVPGELRNSGLHIFCVSHNNGSGVCIQVLCSF